ncbi:unnamed protein product, partial [Schistosoma haematobium]
MSSSSSSTAAAAVTFGTCTIFVYKVCIFKAKVTVLLFVKAFQVTECYRRLPDATLET